MVSDYDKQYLAECGARLSLNKLDQGGQILAHRGGVNQTVELNLVDVGRRSIIPEREATFKHEQTLIQSATSNHLVKN